MALTEKNRMIIYSRVQDLDMRLKLANAVEIGNIDSEVLEEIICIYEGTREFVPTHKNGSYS